MLKKTITFEDYNGNKRTEDHYFNLTKAEITEMELGVSGGLTQMLQGIIAAQDTPSIIKFVKELILKSYGQKSPDGRRFIKSAQLSEEFSQTEAFSELFMELATNDEATSAFVNGLIPADVRAKVEASQAEENKAE